MTSKALYGLSLLSCVTTANAEATRDIPENIMVAAFSRMDLTDITPTGWKPMHFDSIENKTAYFLSRDDNKIVIQAVSHASASAYYKKTNISPNKHPILTWHWKVSNTLKKGNINSKDGDDYAARIYISFDYDPDRLSGMERIKYKLYTLTHDEPPPLAVINYVWANQAPVDTIVSNVYNPRVKMIVVQTGDTKTGHWQLEKRNILEDYIRAFGETPGNISGIAIMTDTDNTGESATAFYGDIQFQADKR